jgi:conjugal transfer pilus assembly protein TraB
MLLGDNGETKKDSIGEFKIVNGDEAAQTKWIGEVAPTVQNSNQQVRKILEKNQNLEQQINQLKKMIIEIKENKNSSKENKNSFSNGTQNAPSEQTNTENKSNLYSNFPMPPNQPPPQNVGLTEYGKVPVLKKQIIVKEEPISNPLIYQQISTPEAETKQNTTPKPENIISTGTISKVILLGGMDAPTMARAKNNPLPVLMKVTDLSFLPNNWKEDIKGCFILGEGYGDLSSERAYIKTTTLSCITKDGYHIDTPFRGAVYGEDGKVGLRGRVVTKQGALIARTLVAGFLQGVSDAFKQSTTVVSVSPDGSTQTIDPDKVLKAGAYGGASEATKRLADFYLKMADQIAPVIEISAGRRVDVIALEPIKLTPLEFLKKGQKK